MKKIFTIFTFLLLILLKPETGIASIVINEVMPNPKGKDQNREWIELYNPTQHNINLNNWKIQSGKSIKTLKKDQIIEANGYKVISLQLKNSNTQVTLMNSKEEEISTISYNKSQEGLSLSLIKTTYQWTTPTKANSNPTIIELKGKVKSVFSNYFIFEDVEKEVKIPLEDNLNKELLNLIIKPGNEFKILLETSEDHKKLQQVTFQPKSVP
jgi:hypothetical protein